MFPDSKHQETAHAQKLGAAVVATRDLRRLSRNPVMLTALAVVHWNEGRLPHQRALLYEQVITWLVRAKIADDHARRERQELVADEKILNEDERFDVLQRLALAMHSDPAGRQTTIARFDAAAIAAEPKAAYLLAAPDWCGSPEAEFVINDPGPWDHLQNKGKRLSAATRFLEREEVESGILMGLEPSDLKWWHPTFQEFLAARCISSLFWSQDFVRETLMRANRLNGSEWREVILLLAGLLRKQGKGVTDQLVRMILDTLGAASDLAEQARTFALLGFIMRDLDPYAYKPADPRFVKLQNRVMGIFDRGTGEDIPVPLRIAAADALGQAGDPRLDRNNAAYHKPWVGIEAGTFWMGARKKGRTERNCDEEAYGHEAPVHEVSLSAFEIARFPVTVGEYVEFVERGGYLQQHWWDGGGFRRFKTPYEWDRQRDYPNRPLTGVSWYEAAAYCSWLSAISGQTIRLPTEAEWERAARGADGRKYPWGDDAPSPELLNYFESKIGHPTPVGIYPHGATLEGICDLAGNVWEWCQDWYSTDYYTHSPKDNPHGPDNGEYRVLRGGAWNYIARVARAAIRDWNCPVVRIEYLGFRVVRVGSRTP